MTQLSGGRKRSKATAGLGEPVIPDKLYFRIGEVARLLSLPAYVLRFWESEFPQLHPNKGGTGQRLYRRGDVETALRIKRLLYDEGYTIPGARQLLKGESRQQKEPELPFRAAAAEPDPTAARLRRVRSDLREIANLLESPPPAARRTAPVRANRKGLHLAARKQPTEPQGGAPLFRAEDDPASD